MSKSYLTEAFKSLAMLNEEDFELNDDGVEEMQSILSIHDDPIEIIDTEAETEDDLEETHIGDAILDCVVCHSKLYKNPKEIIIDDAGDGSVVNYGEECPYCYSTDGFKLIGQIAPFEFEQETEVKVDDEVVDSDDEVADDEEEKEVEVDVEEKEEVDESVKSAKISESAKEKFNKSLEEALKTNSGKTPLKEGYADVFQDLIDRAESWMKDGYDKDEAISMAIDDGLIYSSDIYDIAYHYGVVNDSELLSNCYEMLFDDLYSEVEDPEEEEEEEEEVEESLKECKTLGSAASKKKGKAVEEKCSNCGTELKESPVYDLSPEFDSRKSFYNKARVDDNGNTKTLYSYNTKVAEIKDGEVVLLPKWDSSATTLRHVKEFLKQNGFEAGTLKDIRSRYKVVTEDIKHTETLVDDEGTEVVVDGKTPQEAEQKAKQLNQKLGNKMKTVAKNKVVDGKIQEEFEKVDIDTGDQVIHISSEDKEEQEPETDKEMIVPPTPELEAEVDNNTEEAEEDKEDNSTVDVDFDEFDEETFDTFGESYLKKVYNNVESYRTSEISTRGNELVVEGVIKFKSGKEKKTSFVFEAKDMTKSGRARFVGKNESICSSKKAFTLTGKFDSGKFLAESFNYNYRAKDTDGKTSRLYGTFKK